MRRQPFIAILALAAALYCCGRARAQSAILNLATGGTAGLGGLTFTVSGCGSSSSAGLCNNVMLELTETRGVVSAEFLGNGGAYGSNVLSDSNGSLQYLWFTATVSSSRPLTVINGSAAGSGYINTQVNNVSSGCSVSGGWSTGINCAAYAYSYPSGAGVSPTSTSFGSVGSLNITYTLGIQGTSGQTLVLNSATTAFGAVAEPGALASIAAGLLGLAGLRAGRRRRAASQGGSQGAGQRA